LRDDNLAASPLILAGLRGHVVFACHVSSNTTSYLRLLGSCMQRDTMLIFLGAGYAVSERNSPKVLSRFIFYDIFNQAFASQPARKRVTLSATYL
jgi:hypothetical protein